MNTGSLGHSHLWHIAAAASLCAAVLTFLALVVLMTVTESAHQRRAIPLSKVWNRLRVAFVLAAATGLLASLPFAKASGANSITSFLAYELVYAAAVTFGVLAFSVVAASCATGQIELGEYESYGAGGLFTRGFLFRINPASGLPMNGSLDVAGSPYGSDFHSHFRVSRPFIE